MKTKLAKFSAIAFFAGSFLLSLLWFQRFIRNESWESIEKFLGILPYQCPFRTWTGLLCVFCGMTHGVIAVLRGEWVTAWNFNPFVFIFPFWLGVSLMLSQRKVPMKRFLFWKRNLWSAVVVGITFIAFRNRGM